MFEDFVKLNGYQTECGSDTRCLQANTNPAILPWLQSIVVCYLSSFEEPLLVKTAHWWSLVLRCDIKTKPKQQRK